MKTVYQVSFNLVGCTVNDVVALRFNDDVKDQADALRRRLEASANPVSAAAEWPSTFTFPEKRLEYERFMQMELAPKTIREVAQAVQNELSAEDEAIDITKKSFVSRIKSLSDRIEQDSERRYEFRSMNDQTCIIVEPPPGSHWCMLALYSSTAETAPVLHTLSIPSAGEVYNYSINCSIRFEFVKGEVD